MTMVFYDALALGCRTVRSHAHCSWQVVHILFFVRAGRLHVRAGTHCSTDGSQAHQRQAATDIVWPKLVSATAVLLLYVSRSVLGGVQHTRRPYIWAKRE